MVKSRQVNSCEDCHKSLKSVVIRQSDLLLCDNCEAVRQNAAKNRSKKTSSGPWSVTKTPTRIITPESDTVLKQTKPPPPAKPVCPGLCSIRAGETTVTCFICQNQYHLPCVELTRRPSKNSNWCCSQCKDFPSLIRKLNNNIRVLSAWQESMHAQQQDLKAENNAFERTDQRINTAGR